MQCIKILKGNKLNYWREGPSYGFEMIKPEHCKRLNNEYKIIRRGLQLAGLITNMETSLKDIKLSNSSNPQHQNLLTLAAQSFDCRSL